VVKRLDGADAQTNDKERFAFGANWLSFLKSLDDDRISEAESSLLSMLGETSLKGKSFLDVGSGSGLFSLAARRLGARVRSFDYDAQSVKCAEELKRRYFEDDPDWTISWGNALDREWMSSLGQWDIVYSWGVLHHTGDMWTALDIVSDLVKPGGDLFISIYNDQGRRSRVWRFIKRKYNQGSFITKIFLLTICLPPLRWRSFMKGLFFHLNPFYYWNQYKKNRGMSSWHDIVDWVGGYPFEVAKPEEIFDFYRSKGFNLQRLYTCGGGKGCNQFVLKKNRDAG
jgi:2-polyprenyl-6-hydroxyphenyl methylase/3-demethylubiquinone-9 3-methyltransferase